MKKSILVLVTALLIFSCNKNEDLPTPNEQTIVNPGNTIQSIDQNFIGNWNCYIWVVDEITGATHRREIIFTEKTNSTTSLNISLNDYTTTTTFNQLITSSSALIDSNYFDNPMNPASLKLKGNLLTDSTMNVYQYSINGSGGIDTSQVQLFTKEP